MHILKVSSKTDKFAIPLTDGRWCIANGKCTCIDSEYGYCASIDISRQIAFINFNVATGVLICFTQSDVKSMKKFWKFPVVRTTLLFSSNLYLECYQRADNALSWWQQFLTADVMFMMTSETNGRPEDVQMDIPRWLHCNTANF